MIITVYLGLSQLIVYSKIKNGNSDFSSNTFLFWLKIKFIFKMFSEESMTDFDI